MSIEMKTFNFALKELYNHVGFNENYTIYAIEDMTDSFWAIIQSGRYGESVRYADTMKQFKSGGDYYEYEVCHQRFYNKWVYRGTELTMVIVNTHTDGNKFFAFFSNDKEVL